MRGFGKSTRWSALAVAGTLLLGSTSAFAALDKCQAKIESEGKKLQGYIYTALAKCKDAAQKEAVKGINTNLGTSCQPGGGGCMPTAAKACEIQLAGVYDVLNAKPGKSKVDKFRSAIEKLRDNKGGTATPTCTDADLDINTGLNHLLSGTGTHAGGPPASDAPVDTDGDLKVDPNGHATFMTDWLLFAIEKVVIKQQLFQVPVMLNLLADMATTGSGPTNPSGVASKKATSCSSTNNDPNTEEYRPNLCRFGVECRDHACTINQTSKCCLPASPPCSGGGSFAACDPFGAPTCPVGQSCTPQNSFAQLESAPLDFSAGLGAQRLALGGRLVTEICRPGKTVGTCKTGGGACNKDGDCTGGNAPPCNMFPGLGAGAAFGTTPNFIYLINEPSRSVKVPQPPPLPPPFSGLIDAACIEIIRSEGWCHCAGAAASSHKDITACQDHIATGSVTDGCGSPTDVSNGDNVYPGTTNGVLTVVTSGASTPGDCVDLLTVSAKIMTASSDKGPDNVACTDDDFAAPIDPLSVPGTTGTADGQIKDAVENPGNCTGPALGACSAAADCNPPVPQVVGCENSDCVCQGGQCKRQCLGCCIENVNCTTLTGGGTCGGGLSINPSFSQGPILGGKTSCANYLASNLSGLALVGAAPILNGPTPLGDATVEIRIECQ